MPNKKLLKQILKTLLSLLILSISQLFAQQKQVCFSIDDLPVVNYGINTPVFHNQITDKLLSGLKKHEIQAIGFVNEVKKYDTQGKVITFQKENLRKWLKNGMDLGNHTLLHKDFFALKLPT